MSIFIPLLAKKVRHVLLQTKITIESRQVFIKARNASIWSSREYRLKGKHLYESTGWKSGCLEHPNPRVKGLVHAQISLNFQVHDEKSTYNNQECNLSGGRANHGEWQERKERRRKSKRGRGRAFSKSSAIGIGIAYRQIRQQKGKMQ